MRYVAPIVFLLLLGAIASSSTPALSQPYRARQGVQSGEVRSLDEILNGIRRERPGNLADVQGPDMGPAGEPHYRLKWLTPDGRVLWLDTDARTGRVLGVEGDDRGPPGSAGPPRGGFPGFGQRRGNFSPGESAGGPPPAPPPDAEPGAQRGYRGPRGYDRGPPQGNQAPPPDYQGRPQGGYRGPPQGYQGPPQGYQGPPRGYNQGPPGGFNRGGGGGDRGPRGGGRFRDGR